MAYWPTLNLIDGPDVVVYIQAAAATATPGTGDELGWITEGNADNTEETTEKGPWLNYSTKRKSRAGKVHEVGFTVNTASGAQAAKNAITTAYVNNTGVKVTIQLDPTSGDKLVYDQCIVNTFNLALNAADGHTYEFGFDPGSFVFTADAS